MENGESRRRNIRLNRAHLVRKFLEDLYESLSLSLLLPSSALFLSLTDLSLTILVISIKISDIGADDIEHVGA